MMIGSYRKKMLWSDCRANEGCLRCIAELDEDISSVLPYLNSALRGYQYTKDPLSVTLKIDGALVTVYSTQVALNNIKTEEEADRILEWLKEKVNDTWAKRHEIEPRFESRPKPSIVEILKILHHADCLECGDISCVTYAVQLAEGKTLPDACPTIPQERKEKLSAYLDQLQ